MVGRGLFISLEGGEGSGKSTQLQSLEAWMKAANQPVLMTREPGGTPLAEQLRALIFEPASELDAATEGLLFQAARTHHCLHKILPALNAGTHVVTDRFLDSTRVYQGVLGEQGVAWVDALHRLSVGDVWPDLTILLDIPAEQGLARAKSRGDATRFEAMDVAAHEKIRQGFLTLAARAPERFVVVDATQPLDAVTDAVQKAVRTRLGVGV